MDYEEILDEQYLRELMMELNIELPEVHDLVELPEEDAFIIKTFTNAIEGDFFFRVLKQAGFPVEIETDTTFGNMDPLFNTGTSLLKTKEEYAEQAYALIEKIQNNVEKDRPIMRKNSPKNLFFLLLLLLAFMAIFFTLIAYFLL